MRPPVAGSTARQVKKGRIGINQRAPPLPCVFEMEMLTPETLYPFLAGMATMLCVMLPMLLLSKKAGGKPQHKPKPIALSGDEKKVRATRTPRPPRPRPLRYALLPHARTKIDRISACTRFSRTFWSSSML